MKLTLNDTLARKNVIEKSIEQITRQLLEMEFILDATKKEIERRIEAGEKPVKPSKLKLGGAVNGS